MKKAIHSYPLFLFLLPVFFVLHGLSENFGLIDWRDASILLFFYLGIAILFYFIFWLLYRSWLKGALLSFALLAYQFFFGSVQDISRKIFPGAFINKYSFILPFSLLLFILLLIVLKRKKNISAKVPLYLNSLFLILTFLEIVTLAALSMRSGKNHTEEKTVLTPCSSCTQPDIFIIIADGYPGQSVTRDLLNYDNSGFEKELEKRNFSITDSSRSNYNFTAYSVASLLGMKYLEGIKRINHDKSDIQICQDQLNSSPFITFLTKSGYEFYNYSIFSFDGNPSFTTPTFLPQKTVPITAQTFTRRIVRDLWYHLATTFKMTSVIRQYKYGDKINNEKLYRLTEKISETKADRPKLVYTHLVMPHHPLYYDSAGNLYPMDKLGDFHYHDKKRRIEYLQYSNRKLLALIDKIIHSSEKPPVILLAGDHAIRELNEPFDNAYQFQTLCAWRMPEGQKLDSYKGESHVNQLRIFMNRQFGQKLALLKDSTTMIAE